MDDVKGKLLFGILALITLSLLKIALIGIDVKIVSISTGHLV